MKSSVLYVLALFLVLIGGLGCSSGHPFEDLIATVIEAENDLES